MTPLNLGQPKLYRRLSVNVYVKQQPKRITCHCDILNSYSQIDQNRQKNNKIFHLALHSMRHLCPMRCHIN